MVVEREVRPPLRRWAAERTVRADAGSWSKVLGRARQLDARASAAVMGGLLDAIDMLTPDAQMWLRDLGKQWPSRHVRTAAMAAGEPHVSELPAGCDRRPPRRTAKMMGEQPALF